MHKETRCVVLIPLPIV